MKDFGVNRMKRGIIAVCLLALMASLAASAEPTYFEQIGTTGVYKFKDAYTPTGEAGVYWDASLESLGLLKSQIAYDATNKLWAVGPANIIEATCTRATIGGGGGTDWPNLIGSTGKPAGTGYTPTDWADDTGYPAGAGYVATICGGYDNICNQGAGFLGGGGHNFIKYNVSEHSAIVGGSYNLISSGRGFIGGGLRNTLTGPKTLSAILGGEDNNVSGSYSVIPGGLSNAVSGDYSFAWGRRAKAPANGQFVLADYADADFSVATERVFAGRFAGGYWLTGGSLCLGPAAVTNLGGKLYVNTALGADGILARFYDSTSDMALDIRAYTGTSGLAAKHADLVGLSASSDLSLSPSTDTRSALVLKDGGNIGVGTTSPGYKFTIAGSLGLHELSADPAKPAEGKCVIWLSDGTGLGDDGDVMIGATAGGVSKYTTLFDHSAGTTWE